MSNFRRRRPRNRPRSVMSSPDRVFAPAREPIEDEGVNTQPKPKKRRPFKIEYRYIGTSKYMPDSAREWRTCGSYATEKACDMALEVMRRNKARYLGTWEYRKADKNDRASDNQT